MNSPQDDDDLLMEEIAAASYHLAMLPRETDVALSTELQAKILQTGQHMVAQRPKASDSTSPSNNVSTATPLTSLPGSQHSVRARLITWGGWLAAAAAIAWLLVTPRLSSVNQGTTPIALTRSSLLTQPGTVRVSWSSGPHPFDSPVGGEVIWNQQQQLGFLVFAGLPKNDPVKEQYQLWIIDPGRDEQPIDGGVFDADGKDDLVVPITAKLATVSPKAFAVTIEQPGGVVVSKQERLPLLAALP
jgi:hypothetical protein